MKYLKSFLLLSAALLTFSCDNKEEDKQAPVEPKAPVIASASLKGAEGAATVACEAPVVYFTAEVSVEGSTLNDYTLQVKNGGEIIGSAQGSLEGTSAKIEKELELLVDASVLEAAFYPTVTLKVTNADKLFTEYTLKEAENVQVLAPVVYEKLYLIDNNAKVYEMGKTAVKGKFRTTAENLEGIGTSFTIATAVEGIAPAADAKKWENISTPDAGEYGLIWLAFDMNTQELTKMVNHTVVLDLNAMAVYNGYNVFWNLNMVQDCKVEFLNAPAKLKLQGDRFADAEGTVCRYTGPTRGQFEGYYIDGQWFVLRFQWSATDMIWLTGAEGSLPMAPYTELHPLNWWANEPDGTDSHSALSLVKEDEDNWRALVYLEDNFAFKLYTEKTWASEITPLKSVSPETLTVTPIEALESGALDGNYCVAGTNFTAGLYMFRFNFSTYEASLEKYTGEVPVINPSAAN